MTQNVIYTSTRSQVQIAPGTVICSECELVGEVSVGPNTIIHPKSRIVAKAGPIQIGAFNIIEEQVEIINNTPGTVMKIGDYNVFEVGAVSECLEIGDNNVFECKSYIGPNIRITHGCVIGALCSVNSTETLAECTVIYGEERHRRLATERPPVQTLQLDFLKKVLPNYHHIMKVSRAALMQHQGGAPVTTSTSATTISTATPTSTK